MRRKGPPDCWRSFWERVREEREGNPSGKYLSRTWRDAWNDADAEQLGDKLYRHLGGGVAWRGGWVRLGIDEVARGIEEGNARHENGRKRKDKFETAPEQARAEHVLGRLGEIAYSAKTGIPITTPNLKLDKKEGDVGPWHVRSVWPGGEGQQGLIARKDDKNRIPMALMSCYSFPFFWVSSGWLVAAEVKQDAFFQDVNPNPYWSAPSRYLHTTEVEPGVPFSVHQEVL